MNYQESRAYIEDAAQYGSVLGLENMHEMMGRLGNPQDDLKYVHVAGTNGKGSVIAYLYTTLTEAGYRIGRYISPTLYSYRERLEVAGKRISREKFAEYVTAAARVIQEMTEEGLPHPTPFEIETAVAFLFFREEKCDLVLLEVGMGGDLDATNIIKNTKLAVLVSISMDHMGFLGNSLAEIAEKKAGIIKPGCQVVTASQKPEAARVIEKQCRLVDVPCKVSNSSEAETLTENVMGQAFSRQGENYEISLAGVYQKENAVLALDALELLDKMGYPTSQKQRRDGLAHTRWNGRFSVLCKKPLFVVDGAHNPGAADMMAASIEHYFAGKTIYFIMGMYRDKDYRAVLKKTAHYAKKIITIEAPDNPRALPAEELAAAAGEFHPDVEASKSIPQAVEKAFTIAGEEDVILAFGSLAFIGELTRIVEEREDK